MPLFDQRTTFLLLEAAGITGAPTKTGMLRPKRVKVKSTGPGGAGIGIAGIGGGLDADEEKPLNISWEGTPPAPGTEMPVGSDILSQANWAVTKSLVDPMIDYQISMAFSLPSMLPGIATTLGVDSTKFAKGSPELTKLGLATGLSKILLKNPAEIYSIRQQVKSNLAMDYLGMPRKSLSVGSAFVPEDPIAALITNELKSKGYAGGSKRESELKIKDPKGTSGSRFGKLGELVAGKVADMAEMGIDPLDWVTKAFGADAAYAQLAAGIPNKAIGTESAAGWLSKGKQRGIY
jgi:hypothetical protein